MKNQQRFDENMRRFPHEHAMFCHRPFRTRRDFFRVLGAGVAGAAIMRTPAIGQVIHRQNVETIGKADNVIMILLSGAPSHVDTFDLKEGPGTDLNLLKPETINGLRFPTGIMPKLAGQLSDLAIVRSTRAWASAHNLAQSWVQIGRSPAAALGDIAPNIGSIVAAEKEPEKNASQIFPSFLALNSDGAIGSGYMSAAYGPLRVIPATGGLPDTTNQDGTTRFNAKWDLLRQLDGSLRTASPLGKEVEDMDRFYQSGKAMSFNPLMNAFQFTADESARYGNNTFGNACLLASKVLAARGGTRYVQITLGGWDHHDGIYTAARLPTLSRTLDNGVSQMITDLKASGQFDKTLIVMMGEFGRTPGRLTDRAGRDHFLQQFVVFAGAGVKGGRAIGSTDDTGALTAESGWSRDRHVRAEDIEATIYSAMGIDYTSVRYDDPFKRGFYYVPESDKDVYGPINELWA